MAAPELRLEVSLNLLGFRSEIQKLTNIAQNEFTPKINVKFNRRTLDTELNNLQAAIKRRTYRIEIGGNIDSLPDKIKTLKEELSSLESFKIDLGVGAVKSLSKRDASKIKNDLRAAILGEEQKKLYIPTSIQPKISRNDVRDFKNAVKSKLAGLSVDVKVNAKGGGFAGSEQGAAGLMQYMRSQGMVGKTASGMEMRLGKGGDDIKQQLSDAVQSAEKIKSVFDGIAKNIATTGKSIANVQGKRLGLGNVPLIAGSVEKKVERSTSAIEGTTSSGALKALYPEINRAITSFVALRGQIQQNTSKLSGFSLIIGLAAFSGVPLAKSIVKLTGSANNFAQLLDNLGLKLEAAVVKAASNILGASSGRLLSGTSLAGLLPPAYRGIGPAASPAGLLPPAYRGIMPARETAGLLGAAPAPAGLLPSVTSRGATGEMMRQLTGGIAPPSSGGGDDAGKLAMSPRNLRERVDAILRDYFKVVEVDIRETFNAPRAIKAQLSQFDALFVQVFDDIQNTIRQVFDTSRKAADKVAKQNQIDVAIQSFVAALEAIVRNAERNAFAQSRIAANKSYIQRANVREVGQPLLGEGRIPRMLPPSTGFYRGPYSEESPGETQSQLFARREREARMRSAQRSLRISSELPPTPRLPGTVFSGDDFTAGGGLDRVRGMGQPPQRGGAIVRHPGGPQLGAATRLPSDYFERGSTTDKYRDGLKLAAAATESFRAGQIPFISGLKSIAGEFGEATKQVLLYGTAYKGLAFITSLPGQILNAAKSQQQFTNGLQSATQGTGTFAKELLYVDNVQRAFGLNLQTTRTGFTKLFASMAPTGFDSGSIEKLFTGISAATASLQLTPDKAERVIYAFGQMASKGQIMSEELKGQLGDVLPGALSLFADAAGMSVKEFSEAMEKGEFVGNRFREVFAKVSDELMNRFGSGAQAAAKSLQGLINVVGGDFQRTLESFAPLANAAAESILKPLGGAFRQLSVAAKLATGEKGRLGGQVTKQEELVQDLGEEVALGGPDVEKAKKQYEGAKKSLEALKITLENFNELAKDPAVIRQAESIKAFTDEVGKAASFVKNFALSIGGVLSPVLTFLGTNLTAVIGTVISLTLVFQGARLGLLAFAGVMTIIKGAVAAVGLLALVRQVGSFSAALAVNATMGKTVASMFTALGVSAKFAGGRIIFASGATISFGTAVRALLATTGLGLLIAVVGSVGAAFMAMGQDAKQAAEDAKQAAKDMDEAARTGNIPQVEAGLRQAGADVQLIEDAQKIVRERSAVQVVSPDRLRLSRLSGEQGIYGASTMPTLKSGNLSEIEKNTLAAAGIALPEKGATQRELLKQLNDLLAARKSVLQKGKSQLELAEKQRQRTGQGIPELGIKDTEPPEEDQKAAQRGTSLLNAIEQREEAIAAARKQREESIANIRKNAAEEFMRMEQALADRRLKIEREIVDVKRKSADTLEDIQRQIRIARGEDSDIVGDEQKVADISRRERDANLEIAQRIADEEKEQARNIADFQKKVAKDIQGANEAHTKRMGEIQQGYAKQVAKIIEDGTGKAAKRMAYAGELAAKYIERASLLQARAAVVIPDGSSLPTIPRPVASGNELVYPNLTPEEVPDQFKRIDRRVIELERSLRSSRQAPDIGEQLAGMLSAGGGFEDIAGMEGASLPSAGFDVSKVATDFGTIAAASILRGVLDVSRVPDASRSAQIAQAHNVRVGDRVGYYDRPVSQQTSAAGAPYDMTARSPDAIRTTESRGRLQSTVQDTAADLRAASLELVFAQITEDSAKASAEMTKQIDLIKEQAALIRSGVNSELVAEFMQLEANYNKEVERIKARKLAVAVEKLFIKEAEKLRDTLKAQTKERILQSKILEGEQAIEKLKEEIKLLLIINDEERKLAEIRQEYGEAGAQEIFNLQKIKENIEATRALVRDFVSQTSSDYKGFLKAVISGEDAVDALKQFQEGLTDRVLTIFLDFAMAPVEKFLKESLEGLFLPKAGSIPGLDAAKEATKDPVEATNSNTNATVENTQALKDFTAFMSGGGANGSNQVTGFSAGMQALGGVAFDGGNSSAIDTSIEGWSAALNTSISDSIKESTGKVKVEGATFKESLSKAVGAVGMAAGAIMGIAAGISQVKQGGTANVLGGIGSIMTSIGGVLGGFGGLFGGGGGGGGLSSGFNAGTSSAVGTGSAGWASSFATPLKFANGGMVTGPTLGLIGEGKYNEAIVPLPDGRSIPVQFNQQSSLREAMAGGSNNTSAPSVLSMTFESTNINGVEYVSRDQLEQAMAQTRRQASRDGAQRGMTMTLDKLQQSPSTRSRLGMR